MGYATDDSTDQLAAAATARGDAAVPRDLRQTARATEQNSVPAALLGASALPQLAGAAPDAPTIGSTDRSAATAMEILIASMAQPTQGAGQLNTFIA